MSNAEDGAPSMAPPDWREWLRFVSVLSALDWIVEDERLPTDGLSLAPGTFGLLGAWPWAGPQPAEPPIARRSKLGAEVAGKTAVGLERDPITGCIDDWALSLCEKLPGVHNLGEDREARLHNLSTLMRHNMPAYSWLWSKRSGPGGWPLRDALTAMRGGRVEGDFSGDLLEWRLLQAIAPVLRDYFGAQQTGVRFASKAEVKAAHEHAVALSSLLSGTVIPGATMKPGAGIDVLLIAQELQRALSRFTKQPDQQVGFQKRAMLDMGRALVGAFGFASSTLLEHLCGLIDYSIKANNIRKFLVEAGIAEPAESGKRDEPVVPVLDKTRPASPWDGLGGA
jgi:hypothetical protein